jgi:putative ABC transport system permease protein
MLLANPIKISYKNLMAAKWRSFLTILGIIIGVASVIIIMAIGRSAQILILDQISGVGSNLIGVLPGFSDENGPPATAMGISIKTLTYEDLNALRNGKNVPEVEDGAGYVMGTATVNYAGTGFNAAYTGTTASYIAVENAKVVKGRFFSRDEETNMARVAVLGSKIAEDIFGLSDPLNKTIKIDDKSFQVVGVFEKRGSTGFGIGSQDDRIFAPLKTVQKLLLGIDHLGFARLKVKNTNLISSAIVNTKTTLRERHHINTSTDDDFSVRDQASAISIIKNVTNILRYFLLVVGTISLIVGGVGIMNVMLIAVSQRIREVGLRKAVGARSSDVMTQFLVESSVVSFLGGTIGIIFGLIISYLISAVVQYFGYKWPFLVSLESIIVATLVSILIGIIFGIYPARKASHVSPMEALRYE